MIDQTQRFVPFPLLPEGDWSMAELGKDIKIIKEIIAGK